MCTKAATRSLAQIMQAKATPALMLGIATRIRRSSQVLIVQHAPLKILTYFPSTDGKGLIDVRSATDFTLDLSDTKCPDEDQICCRRPNFR